VQVSKSFTPLFATNVWPGSNQDGSFTLHAQARLRTQ